MSKVIGFDRPGGPQPPSGLEQISVDLTSASSVAKGLRTVQALYGASLISVIHLAAYVDFSGDPNPLYQQVTIDGTRRLLRGLHALHFHVQQFIFSSTMLVHAPCEPGQTINEDWPLDPRWPYPQSKIDTERVIQEDRGTIPSIALRIAGVYDDMCHSLPLAQQIHRLHQRHLTSKVFPGHTSHGQSFVHVDDVIDAFVRVVDRRHRLPDWSTLLIGEPEVVSYDELQHQFGGLIHDEPDWQTTQIPKAVAKAGAWVQESVPIADDPFIKPWMIDFADDHYALDISLAKMQLGWAPKRSLRSTLPIMIAALKNDPQAWYREHKLSTSVEMSHKTP
jgi:nucleoside-diphosphate-sugar epimerase